LTILTILGAKKAEPPPLRTGDLHKTLSPEPPDAPLPPSQAQFDQFSPSTETRLEESFSIPGETLLGYNNTGKSKTESTKHDPSSLVYTDTQAHSRFPSENISKQDTGKKTQSSPILSASSSHRGKSKDEQAGRTRARSSSPSEVKPTAKNNLDEDLIMGYLFPTNLGEIPPLQPRRTLDQYFYTHLESTSHRDADQVVYRYTVGTTEAKIFMVDQLWMWILNEGRQAQALFRFGN
jgi:hypothetical protein